MKEQGILRSVVLPLVVLAAILGPLWYLDSQDWGDSSEPRFGVVELPAEKNPTERTAKSEVGRAGPDFLLETPQGDSLRMSDLQGGPVVLNFWATWCSPCRAEIPELVAAYDQYRDEGLVVVGVNLQESKANVLDFADEFGITFPIVMDRDGSVADAWQPGGPFGGLPGSYFLNKHGLVSDAVYGPITEEALNERLEELMPR